MIGRLARLRRDERGTSAVEFGLITPVMLAMILGSLQVALDVWAKTILTGAVQQAGRNSGLESAHNDQKAVDAMVTSQVQSFLPGASLTFDRKSYENFSKVGAPEDFTDSNSNGTHDPTECFTDENGNQVWDADSGTKGQGGARDVVRYTATLEYKELLPISKFIGLSETRKFSSSTTLMNQPFSTQADRVIKEICP